MALLHPLVIDYNSPLYLCFRGGGAYVKTHITSNKEQSDAQLSQWIASSVEFRESPSDFVDATGIYGKFRHLFLNAFLSLRSRCHRDNS